MTRDAVPWPGAGRRRWTGSSRPRPTLTVRVAAPASSSRSAPAASSRGHVGVAARDDRCHVGPGIAKSVGKAKRQTGAGAREEAGRTRRDLHLLDGRSEDRQRDDLLQKPRGLRPGPAGPARHADHDAIRPGPGRRHRPIPHDLKDIEPPGPLFDLPELSVQRQKQHTGIEDVPVGISDLGLELGRLADTQRQLGRARP